MAHEVFISHSSLDKTVADAVCAALENTGVRCWIAPRNVQPGRSFPGEITRGIQQSKVMVLIFSAHANASEQILREVQLAANSDLRILQFRIENVLPNEDLEYYLSTPQRLDALTPPLESHLQRLVTSVKALLEMAAEDQAKRVMTLVAPSVDSRAERRQQGYARFTQGELVAQVAQIEQSKIQEIIGEGPERIGATVDAWCEDPNRRRFARLFWTPHLNLTSCFSSLCSLTRK
jgi:TIR domain